MLALAYVRDNSGMCERETGQVRMYHSACVRTGQRMTTSINLHLLPFGGQGRFLPIHCIGHFTGHPFLEDLLSLPPVFPWEL